MGKKKQELKKQQELIQKQQQILFKSISKNDDDQISEQQLEMTIKTIKLLGQRLDLYRSSKFKLLRKELYPLIEERIRREGTGIISTDNEFQKNITSKISAALIDGRFEDTIQLLRQFKINKTKMKLGTVQRWVRDIDLNTLKPDQMRVRVLDLVLRCTEEFKHLGIEDEVGRGLIFKKQQWAPLEKQQLEIKDIQQWRTNQFCDNNSYKVIKFEKAADRIPPNFYDLSIYTNIVEFQFQAMRQESIRIDVPNVPGAFALTNVLTQQDCDQLRNMIESMGFELDIPIGQSTQTDHDSRAKGAVWVASEELHDQIFNNCKDLLPVIDNFPPLGINRRFRCYKYDGGNVYRPHIDGAWPGSGIINDQYEYDAHQDRWSKLTFILYLNEDFEGGATTFFTPSSQEFGCLDTIEVRPRVGTVLCFPHGEQDNSLVHEGSNVDQGVKYIIRTDVLYIK